MDKVKRLTTDAMLSAMALLLFIVEAQIPPLVAIPGIKIGLANVVTLFTIYYCGKKDGAAVLFVRIVLSAIFAGNLSTFIYSMAGGIFCYLIMCLSSKWIQKPLWPVSVLGAIAHNIGQLFAASVMMQSVSVFFYLPYLLLSAIITGSFTGLVVTFVLKRLHKGKDFCS